MKGLSKLLTPLFLAAILVFTGCEGSQQTTTTITSSTTTQTTTTSLTSTTITNTPNEELFSRAEQMLSEHGVTITDDEGDWIWTGDDEDNHYPYPVPWADLLGVTFAADADYLYFRLTVAGVYPSSVSELPWYGEDQIIHLSLNTCLDTDNNMNTGCFSDGGAEVVLEIGMMINPLGQWEPSYDFWYGPTGVETPETARYAHMGNMDLVVAVWGGPGFDYLIIVYPVGLLGLHPGQTITVVGWAECSSLQYMHQHATFDTLGPCGMNCRVVIQLPN
jgi:hypothetical protein